MNKFSLIKHTLVGVIVAYVTTAGFAFVVTSTNNSANIPQAILIVSNRCGCCVNLKQEQFNQKFKEKYDGILTLKEYEIHTQEGAKMAQKYHIDGTPNLFIGKAKVGDSCYAEEMLNAVDKALAKRKKPQSATAKRAEESAIISITMEPDKLRGVASEEDLIYMQKYIENTQHTNEQTLASITPLFSNQIVTQAMALIIKNEKQLKSLAAKSPSFQAFKKQADQLKATQQRQLDQLLKTNGKAPQK